MSLGRFFKLNSGYEIPAVGLGTWLSKPSEVEHAVEVALRCGYRHLDCAAVYQNEPEVGRGWKKSGISRDQLFITSKLWNTHHHPDHVKDALNRTLKDLQTDYLDLYLVHWPVSFKNSNEILPLDPVTKRVRLTDVPTADTWAAMEKLVQAGKVRSVGISNFTIAKTQELFKTATIPPAVNQIEAHPFLQQPELMEFMKDNKILVVAYSPLGNNLSNLPRVVDDPKVQQIATKLGKDPAAVLISWAVQRGTVVVPKSVTPSRIKSNFQDFIIPDEEFEELNSLERNQRFNFPNPWGADIFGELGDHEAEARAEAWSAKQRVNI